MVYSRDVLGDAGSVEGPAPYLLLDVEQPEGGTLEKEGEKEREREREGEKGREGERREWAGTCAVGMAV